MGISSLEDRDACIESIRKLADLLEQNPDIPMPEIDSFDIFTYDKESFQRAVRAVGGRLEKQANAHYMEVKRNLGVLDFIVNVPRQKVCEAVVVGKKTVPARPEQAIPAVPETEEDVIEWRCSSILAGDIP